MCRNVKEVMLRVTALILWIVTGIASLSIINSDSLDCVESTCLSMIVLSIGTLISSLPVYLFSDSCGCLGIELNDIVDKFCFHSDNIIQEEPAVASRGFRPSYYDSKNDHERARQKEERSIQNLIRQIDEL